MEAIDGIFLSASTIKGFRKILDQYGSSIAHKIGSKQMLVAFNLLHNLAYVRFFKDFYMQRESVIFASELILAVFRLNLPHPHDWVSYGNYRMREISIKEDLFVNGGVDPAETLLSCHRIS